MTGRRDLAVWTIEAVGRLDEDVMDMHPRNAPTLVGQQGHVPARVHTGASARGSRVRR